MEAESVKGLLWYFYYRTRYSKLGEKVIVVPAFLQPAVPYAKFAVALAALAATVAVGVMVHPPAFVYMIIAAASALGVRQVPNNQVDAVLQDGAAALRAGEAAVSAAKAGNLSAVSGDVTTALRAVKDGVAGAEEIVKEL